MVVCRCRRCFVRNTVTIAPPAVHAGRRLAVKPEAQLPLRTLSQELSQWRQQRAEEALKASVLDEEAAAQFSTAAALAQKEKEKAAGRRSNQAAMAGAEPPAVGSIDSGAIVVHALRCCQPLEPCSRPNRRQASWHVGLRLRI
jgi:hypothetical protein